MLFHKRFNLVSFGKPARKVKKVKRNKEEDMKGEQEDLLRTVDKEIKHELNNNNEGNLHFKVTS